MHRVCTMSHLALAHTTPVSTAFWTTPENVFLWYLQRQMPVSGHLVALWHGNVVCLYEEKISCNGNKYSKSFLRVLSMYLASILEMYTEG